MMANIQGSEEAANIASEFITSLDNLPAEVQHLLQEIKFKETKCQELQAEIAKESARYFRHSLRPSSSDPSAASTPSNQPGTPSQSSNSANKYARAPLRIAEAYKEIDALCDAKIVLARRLVTLLARTKARLDIDLTRAGVAQGELTAGALGSVPVSAVGIEPAYTAHGRNPTAQVSESLRQALTTTTEATPPPNKKRRVASTIKIPSPSPAPMPPPALHQRSRLSRQIHPPKPPEEDLDADADADGDMDGVADADGELDDDNEDDQLYCFCHKPSYGDMIGCDNPDCPYEWFHLSCVGEKIPLPDKWYCEFCRNRNAAPSRKRKK